MKAFIDDLTDEEAASVVAGMKEIAERGLAAAKHLRGDIYEVRADASTRSFRVLFSTEGRYSQVLLSLSAFEKRTQKTPPRELDLAEGRLRDWRTSGARGKRWPERALWLFRYGGDAMARTRHTEIMAKDFLAEIVNERTRQNPEFPGLVAEAETRRKLARKLARLRERKALSQTVVAARMGTAASVVSKLEAGGDVKLSTLQRYFAAIGEKFAVAV